MRVVLLSIFLASMPFFSHAQLLSSNTGVSIESSVLRPSPEDTTTITVAGIGLVTSNTSIDWFINGAETTEFQNQSSFSYEFLNEQPVTFRVVISKEGEAAQEATRTFVPRSVDIVVEAQTLAPAFYSGRHEPSPGSPVRAVAIMNGADTENFSYRWQIDGRVLSGGTAPNNNVITFTAPDLKRFLLRVDVYDTSGTLIATNQRYITVSEPFVAFYENNLLRGMSRNAIGEAHILAGEEVSIRAEPYFVSKNVLAGNYDIMWSVSGNEVTGAAGGQQTITLRNTGGSGSRPVMFELRNLDSLLQSAKGGFSLTF